MVRPVARSEGSEPSKELRPVGEEQLPASSLRLTSTKVAKTAQEVLSAKAGEAEKLSFDAVNRRLQEYTPLIELLVDTRDFVRQVAVRIDKATHNFFVADLRWEAFSFIEGGLLNILSLFRRGISFTTALKEANELWTFFGVKEKLDTLADLSFKALRLGESGLSLAEKVASVLQFILLSTPLACIGIITGTVFAIKSLVDAARIEIQRHDFLDHITGLSGRDRIQTALEYCQHQEAQIETDNAFVAKNLTRKGADPKAIAPFLQARKKWALTGMFGSKSYPLIYQDFKRMWKDVERVEGEIRELEATPPGKMRDLQLKFMHKRAESLIKEANAFVDKYVTAMANERWQQIFNSLARLMVVAASVVTLVALLATLQYWGPAVMALVIISAFIMMISSLYSWWQKSEVSSQEREEAINFVTAHFADRMQKTNDPDNKIALARVFGFTIQDEKLLTNNDLLAKQFEEHLQEVLHQEKIQSYINRAFVNAIQQQAKGRNVPPARYALEKFEQDMQPFLKIIFQGPEEVKKVIESHLVGVMASKDRKQSLEKRLADSFFYYLNGLGVV